MNNVTRTTYVNATCFLFVFWHIYNAYDDNDDKNKKKRVNSVVSFQIRNVCFFALTTIAYTQPQQIPFKERNKTHFVHRHNR